MRLDSRSKCDRSLPCPALSRVKHPVS
jgi:hypothetical protein